MRRYLHHWFLPLWLPAGFFLVWQAGATYGLLDPLFFPPPTVLLATIIEMGRAGDLWEHVSATVSRAVLGFLLGSIAGIATGAAMGASQTIRRSLEPVISAIYTLPKMTLLPMLMLLVGVGDTARHIVIAATCFILVTIHALDGVRSVRRHYVEMAYNCGASPATVFRRVYLPASAPQIFTGVRLAAGRALIVTLSVEMISAREGLGALVWSSWQTFATERLYVAVVISALLGTVIHRSLRLLEGRLLPWRERS